ncbi:hypothetical protein MLP_10580 [Microlunatus phosphovorus NM-1]|uniref:Uncharacterized protein n=1 Tax=Microlunatus phosphovorus (strain ATCC 700054 / DSM 10555 / JCM 9379 / NBRC 101784 / NCIMB 13414 / VKM Ac-1990 / NM-1) TaxID=1032480 RepID=F5XMZ9_MICPN|nr:hypothetical protein MLP_10580 [Microlunatus phosphovorus NM-1]
MYVVRGRISWCEVGSAGRVISDSGPALQFELGRRIAPGDNEAPPIHRKRNAAARSSTID